MAIEFFKTTVIAACRNVC